MTRLKPGLALLLVAATCLWSARGDASPTPRSSTGPSTVLQEAIRELTAEGEALLKDPSAMPRERSNYFAPGQAAVSEAELLEALARRLHRNGLVDAYVKWQLASGLPTKISPGNLRLVSRVYRAAPELQRLPGTTPQEQQQLEQAIQNAKESDIATINERWRERLDPAMRVNDMVLRYRDTLATRLPMSPDTLELILNDAVQRTEAGLDAKRFVEVQMATVRAWAIDGAPSGQVSRVANMFARLRDQRGATVLTQVQWDEKKQQVVWRKDTRRVNPKHNSSSPDEDAFALLVSELQGIARNPGGGLRLKDK